jgi:hypothetical protein
MLDIAERDSQQEFARALGDALWRFLDGKGLKQSEAAELLELHDQNGNPRRSRLNSYFHDAAKGKRKGKRTEASAQVLYLACAKLGFYFDYGGYRLKAVKLNGRGDRKPAGQLEFGFQRQFDLADDAGNVNVRVKRPSGRIELLVSLDAKASSRRQE